MSALKLPSRRVDPDELDPEDRLFRHRVHPDWGVGVWMREERTRRRLRFEDGEMRAFKKGWYEMLEPVDPDRDDVDELFARIVGEHTEAASLDAPVEPPVMPFGRQLDVFLSVFPEGFRGDTYRRTWGADAVARSCLPGAIARASALKQVTDAATAADLGIEILGATDFVTRSRHLALAELRGDARHAFGTAVIALVQGEARFGARFSEWLRALGELGIDPDWRLATTLTGLVAPQRHVVVRRRVTQLQSMSLVPCKLPQRASLAGYRRARKVLRSTRDKLVAAGLQPSNMLDVHVFVWETLRPKGQERAEALGGARGR